jgi:hypothetical protein
MCAAKPYTVERQVPGRTRFLAGNGFLFSMQFIDCLTC